MELSLKNNPSNASKFEISLNNDKHLITPLNQHIHHDEYNWIIDKDSKLCYVFAQKKKNNHPLSVNILYDDYKIEESDIYKYIYGSIKSQIQLPQITEINEILIPIGLEFVKFKVDFNHLMLSFQIHNSYFHIAEQFTFFYDSLNLPIGLPIFDTNGKHLLGFVGERSTNGYYCISGHPLRSNKILLDCKDQVINIQTNNSSSTVYGNMIGDDITSMLICAIEESTADKVSIERINIVLLSNNKIVINGTNSREKVKAREIWAMKFLNTSKITYLLSTEYMPNIINDDDIKFNKRPKESKFFRKLTFH